VEHAAQINKLLDQENGLDRLHPSLRDSFVSLPGGSSMLTPEQLDAIFGGDRRALRDIAKLIFQPDDFEQK